MKLIITSPEHNQEATIAWLELNSPIGNFVIMSGHVPTVLTLTPNSTLVYQLKNGHQEQFITPGGIAHITRTAITLLLPKKP